MYATPFTSLGFRGAPPLLICYVPSLPSTALRSGMRSAQTIQGPQMNPLTLRAPAGSCGCRLPSAPLVGKDYEQIEVISIPPVQDSIAYCRSMGFRKLRLDVVPVQRSN